MSKILKKLIVPAIIIVILVISFVLGSGPDTGSEIDIVSPDVQVSEEKVAEKPELPAPPEQKADEEVSKPQKQEPQETPAAEPVAEEAKAEDVVPVTTCSLSIRCDDVLSNMEKLNKEKMSLIPSDGVIYENKNAVFYEGETVFNVLVRELKKNKIHYEFTHTPIYNSNYINGIGNLYEFDCGELSGWLYKVNGAMPSYGSSQYKLKDKDVIEFIYSCNKGL